jgi:hypothetical protein
VSWRLVNDRVEGQMAIVDITMMQIEPVLLPSMITPDGCMLDEFVRDTRFVLPPAETKKT